MIRKALVTLSGVLEVEIDDSDIEDLSAVEAARQEAAWDCHCDVLEFHDVEFIG